jgi:hypothetical protein
MSLKSKIKSCFAVGCTVAKRQAVLIPVAKHDTFSDKKMNESERTHFDDVESGTN